MQIFNTINHYASAIRLEFVRDEHYSVILLLVILVLLLTILFLLFRWSVTLLKKDFDLGMTMLDKTMGIYYIRAKKLILPKAFAKKNRLPHVIRNMPDGLFQIVRGYTNDTNYDRFVEFFNRIYDGVATNEINIKMNSRHYNSNMWYSFSYITFFKRQKPHRVILNISDSTVAHTHMLVFERFKLLLSDKNTNDFHYSILDLTDDRIDLANGQLLPVSDNIQRMTIQEYHEALKGIRFYNDKGESLDTYFSRNNLLKCFDEEVYILSDVWKGLSIYNTPVYIHLTARIVKDSYDNHIRCFLEMEDYTERYEHEKNARLSSSRDELTNLYNNNAFYKIATSILADTQEKQIPHTLIILNIDDMKNINGNLGQVVGDRVVKQFAHQLQKGFPRAQVIGRTGGDEFVVFISNYHDEESIKKRIYSFVSTLNLKADNAPESPAVTCCAGVIIGDRTDYDLSSLYRKATIALDAAKQSKENRIVYYSEQSAPAMQKPEGADHLYNVLTDTIHHLFSTYAYNHPEEIFLTDAYDALLLIDVNSYNVKSLHMKDPAMIDTVFKNWELKPCYELLFDQQAPCECCRRKSPDNYELHIPHRACSAINDSYYILDKLIHRNGTTYHMHFLKHTTDDTYGSALQKDSVSILYLTRHCANAALSPSPLQETMQQLLNAICTHFGVSNGYMRLFNNEMYDINYHAGELCKSEELINDEGLYTMLQYKNKTHMIYLRNVETISSQNKAVYDYLKALYIESLCIIPLTSDQNVLGFIWLENITQNLRSLTAVTDIASYITDRILKNIIKESSSENRVQNQNLPYDLLIRKSLQIFSEPNSEEYGFWNLQIKNLPAIAREYGENYAQEASALLHEYVSSVGMEADLICYAKEGSLIGMSRHGSISETNKIFQNTANRISTFLKEKYGFDIEIELACGVCILENNEEQNDVEKAFATAMYICRDAAKAPDDCIRFYEDKYHAVDRKTLMLENECIKAMENKDFHLFFQPKVCIRNQPDDTTPNLHYAEVLTRWVKNGKLYSMPHEFLQFIESSGKIIDFDIYVFEEVCKFLATYIPLHGDDIRLSFNITEKTVLSGGIVDRFEKIRLSYQVPVKCLELEFSEKILFAKTEAVGMVINRFRSCGYICTMDDFGYQQSTLCSLPQINIDGIKLDKMFFRNNQKIDKIFLVVKHVVELAKDLNMFVVAEGIEYENEVSYLKAINCDYIQGFYYAKPMEKEQYLAHISQPNSVY